MVITNRDSDFRTEFGVADFTSAPSAAIVFAFEAHTGSLILPVDGSSGVFADTFVLMGDPLLRLIEPGVEVTDAVSDGDGAVLVA